MIHKDLAKYFTEEQRAAVCEWCREHTKPKCKKCGFTETPPYIPKNRRMQQ